MGAAGVGGRCCAVRVARESRHQAQARAAEPGRGDGLGCAEGVAQSQADDEVRDRSRSGEMLTVQIAAGGVGRVVVQLDAPARVLVPGGDDGCGALGMDGAAQRSSCGGLGLAVPAASRIAVQSSTMEPISRCAGSLRWGAPVSTPFAWSSRATAAR